MQEAFPVEPADTLAPGGPDLAGYGFRLIDTGETIMADGWSSSLYRDANGVEITLYSADSGDRKNPVSYTWDGVGAALFWRSHDGRFGLVGELGPEKLLEISRAVDASDFIPPAENLADNPAREET